MNKKNLSLLYRFFPAAGFALSLAAQILIPESALHPAAQKPYYTYLLVLLIGIFVLEFVLSFFVKPLEKHLENKGPFIFGAALLLSVLNLLTGKLALLPVIFFPSFDNILSVFFTDSALILRCMFFSFRLLFLGVVYGTFAGFATGIFLGFSRKFYYWVNPYIKLIGPIPATAWIPLVLTVFPTVFGASVFIVALAVWFPVQLMTSSGIQNVSKSYFEVGRTLGASSVFQILRIGIPASLPNIFQGLFNGVCASFIALMTAEMFGAKAGIGWYISWQKSMMVYSGVYAGLIMIALFCSIIITLLFQVRKRVLGWQKGLIRW